MDFLRNLDHSIFHAINKLAGKNIFFDTIGIFLAENYFVALWAIFIVYLGFRYKKLRQNVYLAAVTSLISRGVVVELLKLIINRPRPYEALSYIHQLIADNEHGLSFPSGHTVIYFSFALAFWKTKYFWPFLILATIASVDRIYVGVHYPADILAGVVFAWITYLLVKPLLIRFKNKKPDWAW